MKELIGKLQPDHLLLKVAGDSFETGLRAAVEQWVNNGMLNEEFAVDLIESLMQRESLGVTAIGHGVAIPHAYFEGAPKTALLFFRMATPVPYSAPDGQQVDLMFVMTGPKEAQVKHMPLLAHLVRLLHHPRVLEGLRAASTPEEALDVLKQAEEEHG